MRNLRKGWSTTELPPKNFFFFACPYFIFAAEAGIFLNLFLNFEQK